jgi:hypothetical protein
VTGRAKIAGYVDCLENATSLCLLRRLIAQASAKQMLGPRDEGGELVGVDQKEDDESNGREQ